MRPRQHTATDAVDYVGVSPLTQFSPTQAPRGAIRRLGATARTAEIPAIRIRDVNADKGLVWLHGSSKVDPRRAALSEWGSWAPSTKLYALDGTSASDVWAVGENANGGATRNLIEHWDSASWGVVPSPNRGSGYNHLYGVAAIASDDAWAIGQDG